MSVSWEASPENLTAPGDALEVRCMRDWFALNDSAVAAGIALLRARIGEGLPLTQRATILLAAVDGDAAQAIWQTPPARLREADPETMALASAAAIDAWLRGGVRSELLPAWRERLDSLLGPTARLSPQARCALLLRRGVLAVLCEGDLTAAATAFDEGCRLAVAESLKALRLVHAALRCIADCLAGQITRADVQLADAWFLRDDEHFGTPAQLLTEGSLGLAKLLLGQAQTAHAVLTLACRTQHPASRTGVVQMLMLCHRIYAAASLGLSEEVQELAQRISARVIVDEHFLLQAYRHLALGVLALRTGQPLRALIHAEECVLGGERCAAQLPLLIGTFLRIQALADLGRRVEAGELLAIWCPRWRNLGWQRMAALALLEQARIHALSGELDRARSGRAASRDLLPISESLLPLHRDPAWLEGLDALIGIDADDGSLQEAHVRIRTLGEFVVEINGRRVFDREWRGVRTKSLLVVLICHGSQKVPMERLADLLWPDSDGGQALQNLKVALSRLRRLGFQPHDLPVNWAHVRHGLVSLPARLCHIDAREFQAAIQPLLRSGGDRAALAQALRLYTGDFLPSETNLPWVIEYRAKLRDLFERGQAMLRGGGERRQPLITSALLP